nr:hypothetical protein [uncultured Sphingomonas sp.]
MRLLPALAVLSLSACTTTGGVGDRSLGWFCSAEASSGAARASAHRLLTFQGEARNGRTEFDLTIAGTPSARVFAEWDRSDLPQLADARYRFRMARATVPAEPAQLQLVVGNAVAARSQFSPGLAEVGANGRDIGPQLLAGAAVGLRLVTRDGRALGSVGLDRASFDLAVQLARQANASALAKASDFRNQCQREQRIIPT